MLQINLKNEEEVKRLKCRDCPHYKHSEHPMPYKGYRCLFNTDRGVQIHGHRKLTLKGQIIPDFCPLLQEKERWIAEGEIYALKIAKVQKQLQEAQMLVDTLPHKIEEMQLHLINIIEGKAKNEGD